MRRRHERDERGAVALFVALLLTVVLLVAALAVDIGMQRVGRSDMQSLADVVALDLARELNGRTVQELTDAGVTTTLAAASRDRNTDVIGYDDRVPTLDVDLGTFDNGTFTELGAGAVPTAVRVTADTDVGFVFEGVTGIGSGAASRPAVAQAEGGACFTIGSYAARLDTSTSPLLGPLLGALGSNVALSAIDYNGLAGVDVELIDLLGAEVGVGTIESLVAGPRLVSLGDFYLAVADVLGSDHTAQVSLLQAIAASVGSTQFDISDILGLTTGAGSGLDATLNLFDLVTAAAAAANGENALSIPQAAVNLGPVANVQSTLKVIEAPKTGCGRKNDPRASASSTQVELSLAANALDIPLGGLLTSRVSLSGDAAVASAKGRLTDVRCSPAGITVAVSDGLLDVDLELEVLLRVAGIPVLSGPVRISGETSSTGQAVINITSDADYDNPVTVTNGSSGLPALTVNTSGLALLSLPLGWTLNGLLSPLLSVVVNPLVAALDTLILAPLLNTLGLDVSGADVYARRVPLCQRPRLVD